MDLQLQETTVNIIPRNYQIRLLEDVKKVNSILYLPTGSGKTYIATMLIREMGESLNKPIGSGRKWTFYIVQSVPLVNQQAGHLRKHLPWNIGAFSGDMNVDYWSQGQWDQILDQFHILVMTAQIYLNNLHHGYMNIKDANLIIFDECHHAVSGHPFRQIMLIFHDTKFDQNERPHILGLTATLVNSNAKNIKEELNKLQQTYSAVIKTRSEDDIQLFSANPKESVCLYDEYILNETLLNICKRLRLLADFLKQFKIPIKNKPIKENHDIYYFEDHPNQRTKNWANYFLDIEVNLEDSGIYAGYLITWHYTVEVEKSRKMFSNDKEKFKFLLMVTSEIAIIRKKMYNYMIKNSTPVLKNLINYTSPKLKKLMDILSHLESTDTCLVFVDRRTTAKMLYHYIKDYVSIYKLENILCEFVVGSKGMYFSLDSLEITYRKQQNNDIIKKFNNQQFNVLITSEVLEEGVDIQTCNYVIRYDSPKNFPSYVQSKGRARSNKSQFIIMVPNLLKFEKVHEEYVKMGEEIDKILVQNDIDDDSNEEFVGDVFITKCAILTHEIAISIINRYCFSLPHDHFTVLGPEWYISENDINKKYKLKLPINSAIKTPIDGISCKDKKNAKKSAAYNACIELYKIGALDENLLPINIKNKSIFNDLNWFPHWIEEDNEASKFQLKPGTNKMKRTVEIKSSSYLHGAYPQVEKPTYLHILHCVPEYDQIEDLKYETFDKLLRSNKEFGILTSKKLPRIADFPIFLNFGIVNVHIQSNVDVLYLSHTSHKKLEEFHSKLFLDVLGVKDFITRNFSNQNNSFLVAPVFHSIDDTYNLDWDVIDINTFVETEVPNMDQRNSKFYEEYLKEPCVISPWYRCISPLQMYIVTDVYFDMTPASAFPTADYETYETYFSDKYGIHVCNKEQPMIKVKSLSVSKINYLTPKFPSNKNDKRSEYIEILVPEFCIWHKFPAVYWLKALMLPTILYRLDKLLLAEDIFVKINSMCNIKFKDNLNIVDKLEIDSFCGLNEVQKKNIILPISETLKYLESSHYSITDQWSSNNLPIDIDRQKNFTILDVYNYYSFMHNVITNQSNENDQTHTLTMNSNNKLEESDTERNSGEPEPKRCKLFYDMEKIEKINKTMKCLKPTPTTLYKLEIFNILKNCFVDEIKKILSNVWTELNELNLANIEQPVLSTLSKSLRNKEVGPKQSDLLKVITPPFSNDMFNYERLETYGDSFLKFAISLVLFDAFESENEGVLTELKMKLVGNRNLLYVGNNLNIGSYLLVNLFEPKLDWVPPCFSVPQKLKEIILESNLSTDVLHQIVIPREDKFSGELSDKTWVNIENELLNFKRLSDIPLSNSNAEENLRPDYSQSDLFLHKQSVSDKMVADCVESLIGTYVFHYGVEMGFKIIHGLGIIPEEFVDAYKPKSNPNHYLYNDVNFSQILPGYEILEQRIGYSFKHKYLLVQALTHPTYQSGLSECYQRLEFLGDAILDFLITTYIIEYCKDKTPGEITDIRSSLVNNITFASLSTRIGLHRFILAKSMILTEAITRFYEHQQKNNHKIGQEILYLIEEKNCYAAESVDVPKVLGDLFESLIAAIYLDSDRDLNFVWKICYQFMENEIKEFCTNVPKNPIRILHETKLQPNFSQPPASVLASTKGFGTMIQLDIVLNGTFMIFYGFGQNKKEAKIAAAKIALKNMKKLLSN